MIELLYFVQPGNMSSTKYGSIQRVSRVRSTNSSPNSPATAATPTPNTHYDTTNETLDKMMKFSSSKGLNYTNHAKSHYQTLSSTISSLYTNASQPPKKYKTNLPVSYLHRRKMHNNIAAQKYRNKIKLQTSLICQMEPGTHLHQRKRVHPTTATLLAKGFKLRSTTNTLEMTHQVIDHFPPFSSFQAC